MLTPNIVGLALTGLSLGAIAFSWTPIVVKNVILLGAQLTPDVTNVSRDGGYSALINGNIVYLYDDTECMDVEGNQLSFVSNTAAYATNPNTKIATVTDFGVIDLGTDGDGAPKSAILANTSVETGGWIAFQNDELNFNQQKKGSERVAIWPGTSPTSISTTSAFLFSPLVYVDSKPQDPSKEYSARGMTLISITAPISGPVASRQGDLIIPGTEVAFGGFSTLIGRKGTNSLTNHDAGDVDVYMLGMTNAGLQLARVGISDINNFDRYTFWDPQEGTFVTDAPSISVKNATQTYLPGTYSCGSVFYSPYFKTFIMIYFNRMADSTFYVRYLNLNEPLTNDRIWIVKGINGSGIEPEDVEALARYSWSDEQKLYVSTPGKGGFNYAGIAHPEYFNRQYFPQSQYPDGLSAAQRQNPWYGEAVVSSNNAKDGQNLLLSWTSQIVGGGLANGIYEIQFAVVEFDAIPRDPDSKPSETANPLPSPTTHGAPMHVKNVHDAVESVLHFLEHSNTARRTNSDEWFGMLTGRLSLLMACLGLWVSVYVVASF